MNNRDNISKVKRKGIEFWGYSFLLLLVSLFIVAVILVPTYVVYLYLAENVQSVHFAVLGTIAIFGVLYKLIHPIAEEMEIKLREKMFYPYVLQILQVQNSEVNSSITTLLQKDYDIKIVDVITSGTENCIIKYKLPSIYSSQQL